MSILGLVTGVGSILGGLFGGGDKKSTEVTDSKTQTGQIQAGSGTQGTINSGLSQTEQAGTSTGSTKGTTTTSQIGSTTDTNQQTRNLLEQLTSALTGNTNQTQQSTQYSADVLGSINNLLKSGLGSGDFQTATSGLAGRLEAVMQESARPGFDVDAYASGITNAASSRLESDLESNINRTLSATGSSETGNSMSALLANRMRNDTEANLAGIKADAVAKGQQIRDAQQLGISSQVQGLSGALSGALTNLLGTTAGAQGSVSGQTQTTQNTTQNTNQTGGTTSTSAGTSQTSQTQIQSILEQLAQTLQSGTGNVNVGGAITTNRQAGMGTTDQHSVTNGKTSGGGGLGGIGDLFKAFGNSAAAA